MYIQQIRVIGICGLLVVTQVPATAGFQDPQVTARQGTSEPEEYPIQVFESPMVLELPLPDLRGFASGYGKTFTREIRRFVCEDSLIDELTVSRGKTAGRGKNVQTSVGIEGFVYVQPSYDRLVDLEISLIKGEQTITIETIHGIDAGEEYRTRFKTRLKLPLTELDAAFDKEPPPKLKIVMSVTDND